MNFQKLFDDFSRLKVGIIGDVMLDSYMWGLVERISPEAPVPIVTLHKKEQRIGGAGNVALNVRALGADVSVLSVTGNDSESEKLKELFNINSIKAGYLIQSPARITTNKIRIISRNQQMMRLDEEITNDLNAAEEEQLLHNINLFIKNEKPHVLIFEDYNKGVLTESLISQVIALCKQHHIITAADPKRKNFFSYKEVDIYKPNLKEVKEGLNILFDNIDLGLLKNIHKQLSQLLHHSVSLITLSEKGIFYQQDNQANIIPSHLRTVADVSGAGDTVIAVASLVYAASKNIKLAAEIANIAGGLVCEEVGTIAINKNKLLQECETLLKDTQGETNS